MVLEGQANNAGTTPMHFRRDTGYCAGALMVFARKLATDLGRGQVVTIGTIEFQPNIINVVSGRAKRYWLPLNPKKGALSDKYGRELWFLVQQERPFRSPSQPARG